MMKTRTLLALLASAIFVSEHTFADVGSSSNTTSVEINPDIVEARIKGEAAQILFERLRVPTQFRAADPGAGVKNETFIKSSPNLVCMKSVNVDTPTDIHYSCLTAAEKATAK